MLRDESSRSPLATQAASAPLLSALSVSKRFGSDVAALDGVSVDIRRGEVVAILGRSGSGKSTLLLCLAGVIGYDSGEVLYEDRSLGTMRDAELAELRRTQFGFVFQLGHLLAELTGLENVALPLRLSHVSRAEAHAVAMAQLEALGVADLANKRQGEMSGGQAQRVAVARALVTEPTVIFADEPTGSLDSHNGQLVMNLLTEAARAQGSAVLLVTHDLQVASYGDREIHLRDGKVVSADAA